MTGSTLENSLKIRFYITVINDMINAIKQTVRNKKYLSYKTKRI